MSRQSFWTLITKLVLHQQFNNSESSVSAIGEPYISFALRMRIKLLLWTSRQNSDTAFGFDNPISYTVWIFFAVGKHLPRNLNLWPYDLEHRSVTAVTLNSVPNVSEIEQFAAELLMMTGQNIFPPIFPVSQG